MSIPPELLAILVCPVCKGVLVYDPAAETLCCNACRLRYRIVNEVPDFLVENAETF